jgi:hypothetical protein
MLEKQVAIDKIEIVENGIIQIRQVTRIIEDGAELSKSFHRWSLSPGQNIADQDARVQAVCNAIWTPELVSAFNTALEQNTPKRQSV